MNTGSPSSHFYYSQRLRLHYVDWGNHEAPLLLLVHGGQDHCRSWDTVARHLSKDWHVVAPDLRGHGDSEHVSDGNYPLEAMIYDLAQLVRQMPEHPVRIIAHSLGGMISLAYAGLYPELVGKLVVIEGLEYPPFLEDRWAAQTIDQRLLEWIDQTHTAAGRLTKRYPTIESAAARMREANEHLSEAQAHHLTLHGTVRNEDGSFSWKFDDLVRVLHPVRLPRADMLRLYGRIRCETLLLRGDASWARDPAGDGTLAAFANAREVLIRNAGHWIYHDQPAAFLDAVVPYLKAS